MKRTSSRQEIDQSIEDLCGHKQLWADMQLEERILLLKRTQKLMVAVADKWANVDRENRQVAQDSYDA
jgi:hypothetical protein